MGAHEFEEGYTGAAEILRVQSTDSVEAIPVQVQLRGHFQPIDGRFHWYGRIDANDAVTERHQAGSTIALKTPHGIAAGRIADVDPWGRFRITGLGTPPF